MTIDIKEYSPQATNTTRSSLPARHSVVAPSSLGKNPQDIYNRRAGLSSAQPGRNVTIRGHVIQIHYSDIPPRFSGGARGGEKLPHYSNYFLGRDSTTWRSRVPHYQTVIAEEVWPGIDVEYRADKQGVEAIYHVVPGADPTQIQMEYLGLDAPLRVDSQGNLVLTTSLGEVKEQAPYAYQIDGRAKKRIESTYRVIDGNRVVFEFDGFDASKELVIDPLLYSTFWGGSAGLEHIEQFLPTNVDDFLLCGSSSSTNFQTTPGAYQQQIHGRYNAYVSKLTNGGREIEFSTLFGSAGYVHGRNMAVMPNGDLFLLGFAEEGAVIPLTASSLDTSLEDYESFVALFDSSGSNLLYSSYLGGSDQDIMEDVVVNSSGQVLIAGQTNSANFPTTPNALYSDLIGGSNAVTVLMDVYTPAILYSSLFGSATCVAYQAEFENDNTFWLSGLVYSHGLTVTEDAYQPSYGGEESADAFLAHFQLSPPALLYSTYFGGGQQDEIYNFELIDSGRLALYGSTRSDEWPTTPGVYDSVLTGTGYSDGFITIIAPPDTIVLSTLLGSEDIDEITIGSRTPNGSYVVAGRTSNPNFPTTPDALDSTYGPNIEGGGPDLFVARLSSNLTSLEYGTYFGGNSHEVAEHIWIQDDQTYWLAGFTSSIDFPVTPDAIDPVINGFDTEGFISCIGIMTNAREPNPVTIPRELELSIFPNPFNPTTTLSFSLPRATTTELTIHNILGQQVEHIDFGKLQAGHHTQQIGNPTWSTGLYFATIKTPQNSRTTKLLLLR
jgi:hypothetical protein